MTGSEARVIAKKALDSLDSLWNKVNTRDDSLGRANYDIVKGAMDELRGVIGGIPDGMLPPKAPNNITWKLNNALKRVDAAIQTLNTFGDIPKVSFASELAEQTGLWITNPNEALKRSKESLSDLAHGRGAFDWLPDFSKYVPWIIAFVVLLLVTVIVIKVKR